MNKAHTHTKQRDMLFSLPWTMLSNPIAPTEFALHFLMKNDLKISHAFICIALARRSLDSRQGHPCSADWKRNPENAATTFIYVVVSSLDWFFFWNLKRNLAKPTAVPNFRTSGRRKGAVYRSRQGPLVKENGLHSPMLPSGS